MDQYVTLNVPTCRATDRAGQVRESLLQGSYDSVGDVAVLVPGPQGGQRLLGLIPVERLLAAEADQVAEGLMDADHPVPRCAADRAR